MPTDHYDGPDRRREPGTVIHVCNQERRLAIMEAHLADMDTWQARQNGSLQRMETTIEEMHCIVLERLPQDLPLRLRDLEAAGNQRKGAVEITRWMIGLFGVGSFAAILTFLFREGGPFHGIGHWLGL